MLSFQSLRQNETGISFNGIVPFKPIEKHSEVTNVVVDSSHTDWFSEISTPIWMVGFLLGFHSIEGVFPSALQIGDIAPNDWFSHLVYSKDFEFLNAPAFKKSEGLFIAFHGFFSQLGAAAINHKFIDLPIKIITFHAKTLLSLSV